MFDFEAVVLKVDLPSGIHDDHLHEAGSHGILLGQHEGDDRFIVELFVRPGDSIVDAWQEVVLLYPHEFERMDPLKV